MALENSRGGKHSFTESPLEKRRARVVGSAQVRKPFAPGERCRTNALGPRNHAVTASLARR